MFDVPRYCSGVTEVTLLDFVAGSCLGMSARLLLSMIILEIGIISVMLCRTQTKDVLLRSSATER